MVAPIYFNTKIVLIKPEITYGTDSVPTGAGNGMRLKDVSISPMEGQDVQRDLDLAFMGAQGALPSGTHVKLTAKIELVGSGTAGTAPAWGVLARILGLAETISPGVSVTYNPISLGHESASMYYWMGNTQHQVQGMRGTGKLQLNAQDIPYFEIDCTGIFNIPTEVARDTPDTSAFEAPDIVSSANTPVFTINGVSPVMRNYSFDIGNSVEQRLLVGSESINITKKDELITATIEGLPLTTLDPYTLALDQNTNFPVNITHGTAAGHITSINAPTCVMQRPSGFQENQGILEWELQMKPLPDAGNDQYSIILT